MRKSNSVILFVASYALCHGPAIGAPDGPEPPAEPSIFGAGTISLPDRHEFCATMSRDRKTVYIGIEHGDWQSISMSEWTGEGWSETRHVLGDPDFAAHDPYLSLDEQRLYFVARINGQADLAYLERQADGDWGEPVLLGAPVNTEANEFYTSFTRSGDLVFSSDRDAEGPGDYNLYRARATEDGFAQPEPFPHPVNRLWYEGDPYIDPEERFLIFASNRRGGKGRGDLYISYPGSDGSWTTPVSLGEEINTEGHELCPMLSTDQSILMYTSKQDIWWQRTPSSTSDPLKVQ